MSWVGNVIAAVGALKAADYNKKLFDKQAALNRQKALQRMTVFDKIERPRLVKAQEKQYSELFVNLLASGAEFREGTTPFFLAQEQRVNNATDLAIADYNMSVDMIDAENQSLLLEAKGDQAIFQGLITAAGQGAKAYAGAQQNKNESGSILG